MVGFTPIIDVSEQGKRMRRPWSHKDKARFMTETLERGATVRSGPWHRDGGNAGDQRSAHLSLIRKDHG